MGPGSGGGGATTLDSMTLPLQTESLAHPTGFSFLGELANPVAELLG
jgi:hypothetical protein